MVILDWPNGETSISIVAQQNVLALETLEIIREPIMSVIRALVSIVSFGKKLFDIR